MPTATDQQTWTVAQLPLPVPMMPECGWTDDELLEFSAANSGINVERQSDGSILMMGEGPVSGSVLKMARLWA
jgi:hypothetical protein